jgi:hypothetical protein
MSRFSRLIVALAILLSAMALTPYVALPSEQFRWQAFINVYEQPEVAVSPQIGAPGSEFDVTGSNFPANSQATISVNSHTFPGTVPTDGEGNLAPFQLTTTNASTGTYFVRAAVDSASAAAPFVLDATAPVVESPLTPTLIFDVPRDIAFNQFVYLPIILR